MHARPLVKIGDHFVLAEPAILTATLRHAVLLLANESGLLEEVSLAYREAVWDTVKQNLRYMGLDQLSVPLPPQEVEVPLTEGLFDLDRDKLLYVQLVVDPLDDYDTDEVFGTWDAKGLGAALDTRLHDIEEWIYTGSSPPNELLTLTVLGGVGRRVVMGLGSKASPSLSLQLAIPAHDLETFALLEGGNRLAFLQFAQAYHGIRELTEVQATSVLDEYELYRHNGHSYYFSDDALPQFILVTPGSAVDARTLAARQRDLHGVSSYEPGFFVEVTYLFNEEVPIYVPFSVEFDRIAMIVEGLSIPVWVVCPSRDNVPSRLRGIYLDIAETLAYWLWQCTPYVQEQLDSERSDKDQLVVRVQLRTDGDWDHPSQPDPPTIDGCLDVTLDAAEGVVELEFSPSIMVHIGGPDNAGERDLVRVLLKSLSQLLSVDSNDSQLDHAIETFAPLGLKKKLLAFELSRNPILDPVDVGEYREAQESETDRLSDEIASHLRAQGKTPGPVPASDRVDLINGEVVDYLYRRLVSLVETIRGEELLTWLIHRHEGVTRRMFYQRLTMPTSMACFGDSGNVVKEVAGSLAELNVASTSIRFLIEYVAARPPNGLRPISLGLHDELVALASSIISWGFESDYLHFGIIDLDLKIVPSGRLGAKREHFRASRDAFFELHAAGEIGRATGSFPIHWKPQRVVSSGADPKKDGLGAELESAMRIETGFTLVEWMDAYAEIWNEGSEQGASVKRIERTQLVGGVARRLGWEESRVSDTIDKLTLRPRKACYVEDPDGNWLELVERGPAPTSRSS